MDHAQRQLTRLQSIPHLWMMYQSERLYRQTLTGDADDVKVETDGGEESTTANTLYIPRADHSSLVEFCRKHEVEILEYEVEAEEARIAALEEEKRREASSRIHIELNVSFHEEASARCLPKNFFSISDHEERQTPGSSCHDQAVLHQDPVQQKLSRVKQVPTLWESFQKHLENEEHPNDVETIKRVIDVFWLENERTVLQHERREASFLNTSFHEESLPHPPFRSQKHGRQTLDSHRKRHTFSLDSTRQSFSSRSLRSIHTAVNDLTGELSPLKEKADTTGTTTSSRNDNKSSHGAGLDRRTQMLELYQKGEGFSSRSMRSVRIAIDGLAGEVDGNEPMGKKMDEKPRSAPVLGDNNAAGQNVGGMFAFLAPKQASKNPIPDSGGGWLCRLSQVSALMTRDLESEITQSDACASTGTATVETKKESTVGEEEEDEIFARAAQIATARRKCPMEETITEETEPSEEEEEDPMTKFLRDPMLEVTIHNNDTIDDETNSKPGTSPETGKEDEDSLL
ncbi:hypothetical protein IV203_011730 [Nitzschia inconspicua]|uniref:Uncharacterized protein n=1 Tax=Nitzschia inconspicua TaxID=303405 RepID=A0A9K3KSJ3_9STRA|nr:hypothetical protein IV203_011730 [Nitzschia inconspicua]